MLTAQDLSALRGRLELGKVKGRAFAQALDRVYGSGTGVLGADDSVQDPGSLDQSLRMEDFFEAPADGPEPSPSPRPAWDTSVRTQPPPFSKPHLPMPEVLRTSRAGSRAGSPRQSYVSPSADREPREFSPGPALLPTATAARAAQPPPPLPPTKYARAAPPHGASSSKAPGAAPARASAQDVIDSAQAYIRHYEKKDREPDSVTTALEEAAALRSELSRKTSEVSDMAARLARLQKDYAQVWTENKELIEGRNPPITRRRGSISRASTPTRARSVDRSAGRAAAPSPAGPRTAASPAASRPIAPGASVAARGPGAATGGSQALATAAMPVQARGAAGGSRRPSDEVAAGTRQAAMLLEPLMERIQKLHLELADRERALGDLNQALRAERAERARNVEDLLDKMEGMHRQHQAMELRCAELQEMADHDRALRLQSTADVERVRLQLEAALRDKEQAVRDREEMLQRKNAADHRAQRLQGQVEDLLGELERMRREREAQSQGFASLENRMKVIRQRNERLGNQLAAEHEARRQLDQTLTAKDEELTVLAAIIRNGGTIPLGSATLKQLGPHFGAASTSSSQQYHRSPPRQSREQPQQQYRADGQSPQTNGGQVYGAEMSPT